MTEVVRTKVRNIAVVSSSFAVLVLFLCFILSFSFTTGYGLGRRQKVDLLQFGNRCSIPRQGGEVSIVNECDASKGLICDGKACVCTFSDQFSYDQRSDECRKKLGKSCRLTKYESELLELPFHQKCHSSAACTLVARSMNSLFESRAIMGGDDAGSTHNGFSMCVCKPGWEPNQRLDVCKISRPSIELDPFKDDIYDEED